MSKKIKLKYLKISQKNLKALKKFSVQPLKNLNLTQTIGKEEKIITRLFFS